MLSVGTQHAASASGLTGQKSIICFQYYNFDHSSGGRSMLRPYSVVGHYFGFFLTHPQRQSVDYFNESIRYSHLSSAYDHFDCASVGSAAFALSRYSLALL